ncbi:MAG TPA: VanZ family protein [Burkholderiales bacterium]|nr:VanZ family protein [Burkholderiales bacterium]
MSAEDDGHSPPRPVDTGARLGTALLLYMIGVMLIVTLLPFHFVWPEQWEVTVGGDAYDFAVSVVLFIPLGFLLRFATPRGRPESVAVSIWTATLISVMIEALQLFDPTRVSAILDVVGNTLGAGIGALAFERIARSAGLAGRAIGWLGLEMPLMALVYLLVPLRWANSLAARGEWVPIGTTFLIGAFGAMLLGGLQRHYFGPSRAAEPHHTAAFAALWFVAGAFALLVWQPLGLAAGTLGVAALCWWQGRRPLHDAGSNRRFEVPLLRSALPLFAVYLVVLAIAPLFGVMGAWRGGIGFPAVAPSRVETAQVLELCAAFTLLGYIATELRGRDVKGYRDAFPRLIAWGVGLAIAVEAARGFDLHGASAARGVLLVAAGLFGGWLYYLQRAHVIWLLSNNASSVDRRNT